MRTTALFTFILLALALLAAPADAEDHGILDSLAKACQAEIESYCSQVTPGEGRLLACFYAHGDKLSGRCEYGLWSAAAELEQFVAAVAHLVRECKDDLTKHCADVELGEGRVASCLLEHKEQLDEACQYAVEVTELEVVEP